MYSNNQIFDITYALEDFPAVLAFGIKLYGDKFFIRANGRVNLAYSEPTQRYLCRWVGNYGTI